MGKLPGNRLKNPNRISYVSTWTPVCFFCWWVSVSSLSPALSIAKPGAVWLHWNVELLIWCPACGKTVSECVSCGSVSGPLPGVGEEGRKMKSDKKFISSHCQQIFHFGLFVGSQGYSNALRIQNFSNRKRTGEISYRAFLRKWQMHESTGGCRGLSVCVTRALCAGCSGTAVYGNKCYRIIK